MTSSNRVWLAGVMVVAALIALAATCASCTRAPRPVLLPHLYAPAVALLQLHTPGGDGHCTAWKIGDGLLATAGHCCEDGYTYSLRGDGTSLKDEPPTVLVDDDVHDVCVLAGTLRGRAIELADEVPDIGAPVWTAGYPRGYYLISSGYWSGSGNESDRSSVVVAPGASGSPILNEDGRAVGTLVAYVPTTDNIALVSRLEWLRRARTVALQSGGEPVRLSPMTPASPDDLDALLDSLLKHLDIEQVQ